MKHQDELYLLQQIKAGNNQPFTIIVNKYKDLVYNIIIKIVNNKYEAEEIAQDTFVKAYYSLNKFNGDSKFSTWLYRIAYNSAISANRKKKLIVSEIDDNIIKNFSIDEVQENISKANKELQLDILNNSINKLNPDEKTIVTLFYHQQESIEDIAHITALSVSNVKVKLHRIRKKLYYLMNNEINNKNI